MLLIHCQLQQEIGEAPADTTRKYYDETPIKYKSDTGATIAIRAGLSRRR